MLKISLFVPTVDQNHAPLSAYDIDLARENACLCLTAIGAGGWTENDARGGWVHTETGEVIQESVIIVWAFLEGEELNPVHREMLHTWAHETARVLNQNAVMVAVEKVDAELMFVSWTEEE